VTARVAGRTVFGANGRILKRFLWHEKIIIAGSAAVFALRPAVSGGQSILWQKLLIMI
jgi:hypothetical protein